LGQQPGGDWANMLHWTKRFTILFSNRSSSSPSYSHMFFIAFLKEAFIRNIDILLCINYIIIICINDNNAVINNNYYGRLQDLILLFKVSTGTWKDFFEMYG